MSQEHDDIHTLLKYLREKDKKILVVGDTICDEYIIGNVFRKSPEADVPVFNPEESFCELGGAANVFRIIHELYGKADYCSVIGNDETAKEILFKLNQVNSNLELIFADNDRKTTRKTRFISRNYKNYIRIDYEDTNDINNDIMDQMLNRIHNKIDGYGALTISDYSKGVVTNELTEKLISMFNEVGIPVLVDPKSDNIMKYKDCYLLKTNYNEFCDFIYNDGTKVDYKDIKSYGKELMSKANIKYLYVTLGKDGGMLLNHLNDNIVRVHAKGCDAVDVTGAGDMVLAVIGCCIMCGMSMDHAVELASYAAGLCVSKFGTATIDIRELEQFICGCQISSM